MYEFFFAKIMGIQLNTHEYILGPPLLTGVTNCGIFTTKEGSRAFHRALGGLAMARGKIGLPATETKRQQRGGHPHLDAVAAGAATRTSTRRRWVGPPTSR
jgi:hypothetical protein